MSDILRVALPLGIGDCHWACQKLRGLSEYHGGAKIHTFCASDQVHVSYDYLNMVPFVDHAAFHNRAPKNVWKDLPPNHRHVKWSYLNQCKGWRGFDYVLVPNGHLETGKRIETWLPELPTDYSYELQIPEEETQSVLDRVGANNVLLYFSGVGPNRGFHNNTWTMAKWLNVIERLNAEGITPVVVGANYRDDLQYMANFKQYTANDDIKYIDFVGQTNMAQIMALIKNSAAWVGLNSGLGIASAMMKTPTVMFWSNHNYYIPGVNQTTYLHANMSTSWLSEDQLERYRVLSFGSPELTPENVVNNTLEVII